MSTARSGMLASVGALGAGFLSALCCAGPLLVVTFGVGAGVASTFEPLRPFFTVLTFALLGLGFWIVYGRPWQLARAGEEGADAESAAAGDAGRLPDGEACRVPRSRTRDKVILWGAGLAAVLFWSFPYWSALLI